MSVVELRSLAEVEEAVRRSPQVLIDLWGTYCAPCRTLRPILEELSESQTDWSFFAANIENVPAVAEAFDVSATPTLLLFKNGSEVDRSGGFIMPKDLEERMNKAS